MEQSITALYVHIPFCNSICAYCDFPKVCYRSSWAVSYLEALKAELDNKYKGPFKTIYIGGGTPTSLNEQELEYLLSFLSPLLEENGEFSIEANPETLSNEKISILKEYGVNRISIGIQSANDKYLKLMKRNHDFSCAKECINRLKEAGLTNLNVDLIYGLPNQTIDELREDVEEFIKLDVPHISAYSLIIEDGTVFSNKGYEEGDQDILGDAYILINNTLEDAGLKRYEISNYCKEGYECAHNLVYWHDEEYVGIGLGAAGYENGIRYKNTKNLSKYLKHEFLEAQEVINKEEDMQYFFLTNLRLKSGFKKQTFKERFNEDFLSIYNKEYKKLNEMGLLEQNDSSIYPTDEGMILLDRILLELF